MIGNDTIDVGDADGYVWVRVNGKGSFASSPQLKGYVEERLGGGETRIVIDLENCPAMDSTFMGTLAGIAMRLKKVPSARKLQVAGTSDRNRQSLEDLGLDTLIDINPEAEAWSDHVGEVRSRLEPLTEEEEESDASHVLDAHRLLCEANEANRKKFATVLDVLEKELGED